MNESNSDAAILDAVNKVTLHYCTSATAKTYGQWVMETVFPQVDKNELVNGEQFVQENSISSAKTYLAGALVRKELTLDTLQTYLRTTPAPAV